MTKRVRKAWNGGSKEAAMEEARKRDEQIILEKQRFKADRVMTAEEYARIPLVGWHMVCRDFDGHGSVGIKYLGLATSTLSSKERHSG